MNTVEPPVWLPPPPAEPVRRSHKGALIAVLSAGAAAGVAAAIAFTAGTGTSANGSGSPDAGFAASQSGSGSGSYGVRTPRLTGTVTAVDTGKSTVTIRTSTGTATYAVDGRSDIDKNGEASLGALKAGDAVTFSTVTTNGKATIAILHSGDETKNRPSGGFGGHGGGWGDPGTPGGEQGAPPNG